MKDKENALFVLGGGRTGITAARDFAASAVTERVIVGDIESGKARR